MASSSALHKMATNPAAYTKWLQTGRLPKGEVPKGPLIELLRQLSPRDLAALRGVSVGQALGYNGQRTFSYGTQALRWAAPDKEVFGSFPAKSWQRHNQPKLTLDDLLEHTASAPQGIRERYPHLCAIVLKSTPADNSFGV